MCDATSAFSVSVFASLVPIVVLPSVWNVPYTLVLPVALATLNLVLAPVLTFKLLLIVVVPSVIVSRIEPATPNVISS